MLGRVWAWNLVLLPLLAAHGSKSMGATVHRLARVLRAPYTLNSADVQRVDVQLADLSAHLDVPLIEEADAVSLRRRLRFEAGRTWLWEPSEAADPGISWELIGIVQECRLYPGADSVHHEEREEIDRTRAGYGSATRTSAYAANRTPRARKRPSAVLRLK